MRHLTASLFILCCAFTACDAEGKLSNPFEADGNWYKANLHVHTTGSDGDVNLATRVKQHRDKGYQVLAVTDHEKTNDVNGYSDPNFLLISGMESHPQSGAEVAYHFVCLNVPAGFHRDANMTPQQFINSLKAVGGEVIFAHPYWSGHTIKEMMAVDGYIGMEVFNGVCRIKGNGSVQWDDLLGAGRILPAVAADDLHSSSDIGLGWTMIKAKELSLTAIMNALRTGCYYSSAGPAINDFRIENGTAKIKCSPVAQVRFFGQNAHFHFIDAAKGQTLTEAEYKIPNGFKYLRVEVVDVNNRSAWTNPATDFTPAK